jgi:hypothetical protein
MAVGNMRNVLLVAALLALPVAASAVEQAAGEEMEELEIRGTRLYEMRAAIVKTEDRFFARYNELNKIHEFDIVCNQRAETGTKITKRVCRTRAVDTAQADEARGLLQDVIQDGGASSHAPEAAQVLLGKESEYEANMLKILNSDRELKKLVKEHDQLEQRYAKARIEQFKTRVGLNK